MTRITTAIACIAGASAALAQDLLNPAWEVGERPGEIVTADFDGDGHPDAAVLNEWGASVSLLIGDGAGGFQTPRGYGLGAGLARAMAAGDIDGDGDDDLFTATWGPSTRLLLNRGDGTLESRPGPTPAGDAEHAALGDLDGDGALDAVLALGRNDTVQILLGAGDSSAESLILGVGQPAQRVRLADLDDDGDLDIVVVRWTAYQDSISVFLNRGDGTFSARADYQGGFSAQDVAIGDVTGDERLDLVVGHARERAIVLPGRGDGTFGPGQEVSLGAFCATRIALSDTDGDSALDIVATSGRGGVTVRGDGAGGWGEPVPAAVGASAHGLALADIDADGDADWLLSDLERNHLELLLNDGHGTFEAFAPALAAEQGYSTAVMTGGDINGDGLPDLIVEGSRRACVYLSDPAAPTGFRPGPVTPDLGRPITTLAAADLNGDGRDDLLIATLFPYAPDPDVRAFLTTAAGSFEDLGAVHSGELQDMLTGDFTGDGALDVLVVGGATSSQVTLLPGLGDGRFSPARHFDAPRATSAAAIDMTGDSALDVLVNDRDRHIVQVLVNDGAGHFTPGEEFVVPDPSRVAAADLNGDSQPDIVAAGMSHAHVLLSQGGSMAAPEQLAVPAGHHGMTLRDMNGDDHPDLAILIDPAADKPGAMIFINDGAGAFSGPGLFWLGQAPRGLVAEDFDGDRDVDIAAVAAGAPSGAALRILDNRTADGGCRADLTGDGALDFFDFLAFQDAFSAGDPAANFTGDGGLDFFDFLVFQEAFAAGCPAR